MNETVINAGIIVAYILLGLAALVAIVGPLIQLILNFKSARTTLVGVLVLVIILFIGYSLSTNETYENAGPIASQWIGGGIRATMILIGLAILAAVYTEVAKFFK
jgi:predicted ABC-type exoprotein transport system permease subunit